MLFIEHFKKMNEYSKRKRKKKLSKSFWCGCLSWKMLFFFEKFTCLFYAPIFPFMVEWGRWALLNKSIQVFFAWFLGRPLYFWGAINWGLWTVGTGAFPHPLFLWSLGHVMMIFNHFFVLILTQIFFSEWRRKNSGSTKFGIAHLRSLRSIRE